MAVIIQALNAIVRKLEEVAVFPSPDPSGHAFKASKSNRFDLF